MRVEGTAAFLFKNIQSTPPSAQPPRPAPSSTSVPRGTSGKTEGFMRPGYVRGVSDGGGGLQSA